MSGKEDSYDSWRLKCVSDHGVQRNGLSQTKSLSTHSQVVSVSGEGYNTFAQHFLSYFSGFNG